MINFLSFILNMAILKFEASIMNQFEIIEKPWGREEVVEINEKYMVKKLTMWAGHRCSLQYHNIKKETIYVLSGVLKIIQGSTQDELEEKLYRAGDTITIPPGLIHRMEGVEDAVYLEASTPEMDDVVRLVDDYQRAQQ
jgi:mannose-6-phosphate isomerase